VDPAVAGWPTGRRGSGGAEELGCDRCACGGGGEDRADEGGPGVSGAGRAWAERVREGVGRAVEGGELGQGHGFGPRAEEKRGRGLGRVGFWVGSGFPFLFYFFPLFYFLFLSNSYTQNSN
jgi:hypothetical protein